MSADRLGTPERVLGMPTVDLVGFAHHAGRMAVAFGAKLPKGVEAGQVAQQAAEAWPVVLAIRGGRQVDPGVVGIHVERATELGRKLGVTKMPAGFLNFVNVAMARASRTTPEQMPGEINAAIEAARTDGSLATVEPFVHLAEQVNAGEQLTIELGALAHHIQDTVRFKNGRGKIDPAILAEGIYDSASAILDGRMPLPMVQRVLETYIAVTGRQPTLPAFEGKVRKNMTAAAPAIMEAVNAALPEHERDHEFLDNMRTSVRGKLGGLVGASSLEAIEEDVTPMLLHLRGMLSGNPQEARQELGVLLNGRA